ncbi:MAG TPA: hypothetical protein VG408_11100 [Actinomycetota bacterium]|nr:hypothetical protein [Actinomycetota bacterium]
MTIEVGAALERVLMGADEWQLWRVRRLRGEEVGDLPELTTQDVTGGFVGYSGVASPAATGRGLAHLAAIGLGGSGPAAIAGDWLLDARTPAGAWLDPPTEVPDGADSAAAGRVWSTAAAASALLAVGRDPGQRSLDLLRGEADQDGRFTGGVFATCAAAAAYWRAEGPKTEMAEWALRWVRENDDGSWGPEPYVAGLTFWAAARIPADHPSVEFFTEELREQAPIAGWAEDPELTLLTLEVLAAYER